MTKRYQYVIIDSGVMGLSIAYVINEINLDASILIIDKEPQEAVHT